ncbi:MAG: type II secretion system protein GspE, partial [Candidatus Omnitrophica bacterium]|nr:type II secretion system protein GspE [Candidatus Omnitrophota bacterium]
MPTRDNILIGEMLVSEGLITSEQLDAALREQKKSGELICTILVRLGLVTEEKALNVLSRQLNIPYIKLKDRDIDSLIISKVPAKFASHYKIIPIEFQDNYLTIAMADPLDVRILDDLKLILGLEVKGVLASEA